MIRFKEPKVIKDLSLLVSGNSLLLPVLYTAAGIAQGLYGKNLVITSLYRHDDPPTVHNLWRGADCRVFWPHRPTSKGEEGLDVDETKELIYALDNIFEYRRSNGTLSSVAHFRDQGTPNVHLHLQAPIGKLWGTIRRFPK